MMEQMEQMEQMAEAMATKIRMTKRTVDRYESRRECPWYSERKGMERALDVLGIPFSYEYDNEYNIVAVTVNGFRTAV